MYGATRTVIASAVSALLVAGPANAAQAPVRLPDQLGGEADTHFVGKGKNWSLEVHGIPGTRTLSELTDLAPAVCRKPGSTWRGKWTFLVSRRVKLTPRGRLTYRPRGRWERAYHTVWKLRLSRDGQGITGRLTAHWRSNIGESCKAANSFSARRVVESTYFRLGNYAGTTSQGLAASFKAVFQKSEGSFVLQDITIGVRLACEDGSSLDTTLTADRSGGFTFWPSVHEGQVAGMILVGQAPDVPSGIDSENGLLTFAYDRASGTIHAEAQRGSDESSVACSSGPVTFSVTLG